MNDVGSESQGTLFREIRVVLVATENASAF